MFSGHISVQIGHRLEGRLKAASNRLERTISYLVRQFVEEGLDSLEGLVAHTLDAQAVGRILVAVFQIEELVARTYDPDSEAKMSREERIKMLEGVSERAISQTRKLLEGGAEKRRSGQ